MKIKKKCIVNSCDKEHKAKGYCAKHYAQIKQQGKILSVTKFDPNQFTTENDICYILIHNSDKKIIIDIEDIKICKKYKWYLSHGYATTNIRKDNGEKRTIALHNLIMGFKGVDHKDRNPLNNRKENLRKATQAENLANKSKKITEYSSSIYKGVCWYKPTKKWRSRIKFKGLEKSLGSFVNEKEAAIAYNKQARKYFGNFAYQNKVGV